MGRAWQRARARQRDARARGAELELEAGRLALEQQGLRERRAAHALGTTLGVAPEVPRQLAGLEAGRQRQLEPGRLAELAVGRRRHARQVPEVLVEGRGALEAAVAGRVEHAAALVEQQRLCAPHARAHQEIGRRQVVVAAEERVELGRAELGRARQRARVREARRIGAYLGCERASALAIRVEAPVEVVRPAALAGPQPGRARRPLVREEAHVLRLRHLRATPGQAIDPGREHAHQELAAMGRIARLEAPQELAALEDRPARHALIGPHPRRPRLRFPSFESGSGLRSDGSMGGARTRAAPRPAR